MNLTEVPTILDWSPVHYIYVEKTGPFQTTAMLAWQELHKALALEKEDVVGYNALYKIEPQMLYRAGARLKSKPSRVPTGLVYEHFLGGKYAVFTLTGSYSQLPAACGRVMEIVAQTDLPRRADFYIENYVNDPKTTSQERLITQIMVPTK